MLIQKIIYVNNNDMEYNFVKKYSFGDELTLYVEKILNIILLGIS